MVLGTQCSPESTLKCNEVMFVNENSLTSTGFPLRFDKSYGELFHTFYRPTCEAPPIRRTVKWMDRV